MLVDGGPEQIVLKCLKGLAWPQDTQERRAVYIDRLPIVILWGFGIRTWFLSRRERHGKHPS